MGYQGKMSQTRYPSVSFFEILVILAIILICIGMLFPVFINFYNVDRPSILSAKDEVGCVMIFEKGNGKVYRFSDQGRTGWVWIPNERLKK